ncbi:hypothetical protein [Streptomyces halobius]|uniref:Uncharacterized protein n=1 Tax=Streptomyces halobius TaxID=2879846 RepID=A0ABY4MI87_9ACTN|nr:hypothetical protein [Streptomyces halobius]UQA97520.1 hypothetical protein K9S39_41755 [Streptomyces halobius]
MLTASRLTWFAIAFAFAVPSTLVMFRENGVVTRDAWIKSFVFAATIAAVIAVVLDKGSQ